MTIGKGYWSVPEGRVVRLDTVVAQWEVNRKKLTVPEHPHWVDLTGRPVLGVDVAVEELLGIRQYEWTSDKARGGAVYVEQDGRQAFVPGVPGPVKWQAIKDGMAQGRIGDPIKVWVTPYEAIVGEGNHRVGIAAELGIRTLPVEFFYEHDGYWPRKPVPDWYEEQGREATDEFIQTGGAWSRERSPELGGHIDTLLERARLLRERRANPQELRLSQKDARLLVEELETGTGGLAELAARKPAVVDFSQQALYDIFGPTVALYRILSLHQGDEARADTVVSTTTDPRQLLHIAEETTGAYFTTTSMQILSKTLIRYDVPIDRCLVFVPALCEAAWEQQGAYLDRLRLMARTRERVEARTVLEAFCGEQEVVADVTDIPPTDQMPYYPNAAQRLVVKGVAHGTWMGGKAYVRWLKTELSTHYDFKFVDGRFEADPEGARQAAREFNALARRTRSFFAGSL